MRTMSEFKHLLQKAFDELESEHNITARQDYECCASCGVAAIGNERSNSVGFCFYHHQDNESLYRGGSFYLDFGNDVGGESVIPIGRTIVEVLKKYNIITEWNGTYSERIYVIAETQVTELPDDESDDDENDDE